MSFYAAVGPHKTDVKKWDDDFGSLLAAIVIASSLKIGSASRRSVAIQEFCGTIFPKIITPHSPESSSCFVMTSLGSTCAQNNFSFAYKIVILIEGLAISQALYQNDDVLSNLEGVLEAILSAPHPPLCGDLSHKGER